MSSLVERYAEKVAGVLGCYDRVVIQGTLVGLSWAAGMTAYLRGQRIRVFDYPRFAEGFRDRIRENAERVAREGGVEIEFIGRADAFRKADRVKEILARRGEHEGLVHVFSAMEVCDSYRPWHDKKTGETFLRPAGGKCLHYYFYFIDRLYGLCFLRVPTWSPFRLQFYFNGHSLLAGKLREAGIAATKVENAFFEIADFEKAQRLADEVDVTALHRLLDEAAARYCPVAEPLGSSYHWHIAQAEYSTDIVFRRAADLAAVYEGLVRTAVHAVKVEDVAMFLGQKYTATTSVEIGSDLSRRKQGMRLKHHMGRTSIKMYDKLGRVLRIETTTNDVTFFRHYREVVQRDGLRRYKLAPLKKTIYSLQPDLRVLLASANKRYLAFLSDLDDPTVGTEALERVTRSREDKGRTYRGLNFFAPADGELIATLVRGEHTISGFRSKDLRRHLPRLSSSQLSHCLKRLRLHGLIKRIGRTYKYYVTAFGESVLLAGLKVKELVLIPDLALRMGT